MNNLEFLRRRRNIPRTEMARQLNISDTLLWKYERGKLKIPFGRATKILKILNTSFDKVFTTDVINYDVNKKFPASAKDKGTPQSNKNILPQKTEVRTINQEISIFKNEKFGRIRVITKEGQLWFVAKDVCEILDISNSRDALSRISYLMKNTVGIADTMGKNHDVNVVSEAGLYKLAFTSRKEEAEKFTDWVAAEVLPAVRKHGAYMTPETIQNTLTDPDFIIKLATTLKEEQEKRKKAENELEKVQPKILFTDAVGSSESTILIRDLAKILNQNGIETGEKKLFEWLRENGYLIKAKGLDHNMPTQKAMNLGLFRIKETPIKHSNGEITVSKTTRVTAKGQMYFVEKFLKEVTA